MSFLRMTDLDLRGKRVLIREDLNVPIENGRITSTQRLDAALPTIRAARDAGARVMVLSHLGRPREGRFDEESSLAPVAAWLGGKLGRPVRLVRDYLGGVDVAGGEVVVLENCRMNTGEGKDDAALSKKYAALCDIYVMDAFGTAHRAQASTHGAILAARTACAGPLLAAELDALGRALQQPARPLLAIVAGSKVSTKLTLLENLIGKVDQLIVGGGIANTFLAAQGLPVGKSLHEPDLIPAALRVLDAAKTRGAAVPLPEDVVVAPRFAADAPATVKPVAAVADDDLILDIGPQTAARYAALIARAGTVLWNGPVGVFEFDAFGKGTEALACAIAASPAFSIAGGGAFLEFLEGKELPAVAALRARSA